MRVDDFDYELPKALIAQAPATQRDLARLLVVHRADGRLEHRVFRDVVEYLRPGDCLVLNDSRVAPARLLGKRRATGGKWEGLFLREAGGRWEMLTQTRGKPKPGEEIELERGGIVLRLMEKTTAGTWWVEKPAGCDTWQLLDAVGQMPLPPYIRGGREAPGDRERYQTVYARLHGSVAAPTAGLHFTPELLDAIARRGVAIEHVTLHVGPGTFLPVTAADTTDHVMHEEICQLDADTAARIAAARSAGGRVIAVGTTAVRTLESAARSHHAVRDAAQSSHHAPRDEAVRSPAFKRSEADAPPEGETPTQWPAPPLPPLGKGGQGGVPLPPECVSIANSHTVAADALAPFAGPTTLFITPPYEFRVVDAMITNFHLPKSTLLMLVSAFAGREQVLAAYRTAIKQRYRFYSYGDAMLIV